MQIIAGKHRGRKLEVPPGRDIRPTSGRVREAIFNVLIHAEPLNDGSPRLAGQWVADLCCGSGAMGLEALSRGAAHAVFVDRERGSLQLARTAAERFGEAANGHFLRAEATALPAAFKPCSVVFVDPPYGKALLPGILKSALEKGWLAEEGWFVAELSGRESFELPAALGLEIHSDRDYGNSRVLFLRRNFPPS